MAIPSSNNKNYQIKGKRKFTKTLIIGELYLICIKLEYEYVGWHIVSISIDPYTCAVLDLKEVTSDYFHCIRCTFQHTAQNNQWVGV